MWDHLGAVATVIMVAFNIGTGVVAVYLKVALSDMRAALTEAINDARIETDERIEKKGREYGETVAAVREKLNLHELFCRDTYVRRDSFYKVSDDMSAAMRDLREAIEKRLERMEEKIDNKV